MGLDATVMCNCWKEGKTTPPPFSSALIDLDDDGYLELKSPWQDNIEAHTLFEEWRRTCCPHEDMCYADEWVANWFSYRVFQHALERVGWQHFQALKAGLAEVNGGVMSAVLAREAMRELEYFRHTAELGAEVFLINSETSSTIKECEGIWIFDGRAQVNVGIDRCGFFIISQNESNELFRAMRLEQRPHELQPESGALFINLDTGTHFTCESVVSEYLLGPNGAPVNGGRRPKTRLPRFMHIEERALDSSYFDYILIPLSRLFQAAVETGNPIRWS